MNETQNIGKWIYAVAGAIVLACFTLIFATSFYACPLCGIPTHPLNPPSVLFEEPSNKITKDANQLYENSSNNSASFVNPDNSTNNTNQEENDQTPGTGIPESPSFNMEDEFHPTTGNGNFESPSYSLSEAEMLYGHGTEIGKWINDTILKMLDNESRTTTDFNEETGEPDVCGHSEKVIDKIKLNVREIFTVMADDGGSDDLFQENFQNKITKLIFYIISITFPETELSIAKILSKKVSDFISVIVSDRHKKATIPSNGTAEISKSDFVKLAMMDVVSKIVSGESLLSSHRVKKRSLPAAEETALDFCPKYVIMGASLVGILAALAVIGTIIYFEYCSRTQLKSQQEA